MNKEEFLNTLDAALTNFKAEDKKEILYDYEEHFRIGKENGKDEEELIKELGNPNSIADQYKTSAQDGIRDSSLKEERPQSVNVLAAIGMIFFNLIFILGPYLGIVGALIGLFASAAALMISGIAVAICVFVEPLYVLFIHIPFEVSHAALFFIGVGIAALGALFLIGMCYVSKFVYKGTAKYISWNMKIIKG